MHLNDIVPTRLLKEMVDGGYVRVQTHPTLPLFIGNYTEKAQYEQVWNDATLNLRGMIWDGNRQVIARPYRKFFNYGDAANTGDLDLTASVIVTDKLDGSLGIAYPTPDGPAIATRGSFTSEQARHATALLRRQYPDFQPDPYSTHLFEIIYPGNRIVLDYGPIDDLVLHGVVDIDSGRVLMGRMGWDGPLVETFAYNTLAEALAAPPRPNAEGLVVRYLGTGQLVKIKQDDYVALHRVITNTSARVLWEYLAVNDCKDLIKERLHWGTYLGLDPARAERVIAVGDGWLDKLLNGVPDEFYGWVKTTIADLTAEWAKRYSEATAVIEQVRRDYGDDRKAAFNAVRGPLQTEFMQIFTGNGDAGLRKRIWRDIYPEPICPFAQTEAAA